MLNNFHFHNKKLVCNSMDLRFNLGLLEQLRGCRVVEGSVIILLMDDITQDKFVNYSFPELVEITGFLMLYRISGIKSLNDLFPNLAVIRGKELFKDYSLIIYEGINLEEVGLTKLQTIVRGGVRIEKNDYLCFADRIDWQVIAPEADHVITVLYDQFRLSLAKTKLFISCIEKQEGTTLSTL
jgi:insulin receptor